MAAALELPLDVMAVSKMTLPGNTEVGYGAVAFDGTTLLNRPLIRAEVLTDTDIRHDVDETKKKVLNLDDATAQQPAVFQILTGRRVFLVDDGLASGFTMRHGDLIGLPTLAWPSSWWPCRQAIPRRWWISPGAWIGFTAQTSGTALGFCRRGCLRDLERCLLTGRRSGF